MASSEGRGLDLTNETAVNVVALLKEPVGSKRVYSMHLDAFPLADDLQAARLDGEVRLTKLRDEILGAATLAGQVHLDCVRCLRTYVQDVEVTFAEEFRQVVDAWTGVVVSNEREPDEEAEREAFEISSNHEIDLGEAIRQHLLLALPMRPDCGDICPGPDTTEAGETPVDDRLAALAALLDE
jgi:uncharacterized protein